MPKWAGEMRERQKNQHLVIQQLANRVGDLRDRLGTSTPLIIWNIAVMIAIACLGVAVAKLYGIAP